MTNCCATGLGGRRCNEHPNSLLFRNRLLLSIANDCDSPGRRLFSRLAQEAAKQNQNHISYLEILLESEIDEREHNAIARRIREAQFPKVKTLEEFEFRRRPHTGDLDPAVWPKEII